MSIYGVYDFEEEAGELIINICFNICSIEFHFF